LGRTTIAVARTGRDHGTAAVSAGRRVATSRARAAHVVRRTLAVAGACARGSTSLLHGDARAARFTAVCPGRATHRRAERRRGAGPRRTCWAVGTTGLVGRSITRTVRVGDQACDRCLAGARRGARRLWIDALLTTSAICRGCAA
jgi:hypothetical protein